MRRIMVAKSQRLCTIWTGAVVAMALQKAWRSGSAGFFAGTMQAPCFQRFCD